MNNLFKIGNLYKKRQCKWGSVSDSRKIKLTLEIGRGRCKHDFIITQEEKLPSKIILGWNFIMDYEVSIFQGNPLSLCIEGNRVTIEDNLLNMC